LLNELAPENATVLAQALKPIFSHYFCKSEDFLYKGNKNNKNSLQLKRLNDEFLFLALDCLDILKLLAEPGSALVLALSNLNKTSDAFYEAFYQYFDTSPLLQKSWKLACIPDKAEKIQQTYQAVLEERGLSTTPAEGVESPRLGAVKRLFN
jgi:hypothetical protein